MSSAAPQFPLQQTIASLGRVALTWLDPSHPLRKEALTSLQVSTGYTFPMIENALDAAFEELRLEKLLSFCDAELRLDKRPRVPQKVLHILAGNVFTAWLPGAVISLLLGAKCDLKPSTQEPVFALLWKRSVELVDPLLGDKVQIVRWQEDLLWHYQAVIAYGSDPTLELFKAKVNPETRFIGYGHKFSVGVVWKEAWGPDRLLDTLARLQKAIEPFDLQGCLSPQIIYVEGSDPGVLDPLASRVRVMPQVKRFDSWEALKEILDSCRLQLSTVGVAGASSRLAEIHTEMEGLGISRVCDVAEMQRPPLTWRNGGVSLVEALTSSGPSAGHRS